MLISLQSEWLKTRRSAAFLLSIAGGLFVPFILTIAQVVKPEIFAPKGGENPWLPFFKNNWQSVSAFLMPMFIILLCSLVVQIEYRNNAWKQVLASPRSYADVYFSKFIVIQLLILFCFLVFQIGVFTSAVIADLSSPLFTYLENGVDWAVLSKWVFRMYLSTLAISSLQYWLSIRFKSFIVPLGIGLALLIATLIVFQWDKSYAMPYSGPIHTYMKIVEGGKGPLQTHEWFVLGYAVLFLTLGFLDFRFRKSKG